MVIIIECDNDSKEEVAEKVYYILKEKEEEDNDSDLH